MMMQHHNSVLQCTIAFINPAQARAGQCSMGSISLVVRGLSVGGGDGQLEGDEMDTIDERIRISCIPSNRKVR